MKYADMKSLSKEDITKKLAGLNQEIFQAQMKNTLGQLSNPVQIRFMRRDLARMHTALTAIKQK